MGNVSDFFTGGGGGGLPGGMTKDPRLLPMVDATAGINASGSASNTPDTATFWGTGRDGLGSLGAVSTSATADTYGTICDLTGRGFLFHVLPPLHNATTDTVSFKITVDGTEYIIAKTGEMTSNVASGRLFLGCADLTGAATFYTTSPKHLENYGNNASTTASFQNGLIANLYQPWRILMHGMVCLHFETSLKVETKVSALNGSGTYRQYSAATYKLL